MLPRASLLRVTSLVLAVGAAVVACGREDVELGAGATDAGLDAGPPPITIDDAGAAVCAPLAARACAPNGSACRASIECCSARCEGNECLAAGACAPAGTACTSRASCCSGRCEPTSAGRVCLDYCAADGAPCTRALDCCAMACHGGVCGGALCTSRGESCARDADCCSGACNGTTCIEPPGATCRATGDECGEGDAGIGCCSGKCGERCDLGPGPCRETGAICNSNADCCRGTCVGAGEVSVCTAPCLADGAGCANGQDCCNHYCSGSPLVCGAATSACRLIGASCKGDVECCSGQCLAGFCGNNCAAGE